jgi:hypothetical protein
MVLDRYDDTMLVGVWSREVVSNFPQGMLMYNMQPKSAAGGFTAPKARLSAEVARLKVRAFTRAEAQSLAEIAFETAVFTTDGIERGGQE